MRRPGSELLDEVSERALLKLGRGDRGLPAQRSRASLEDGVATGDFTGRATPTLLANTLYASGLGALQLARVGPGDQGVRARRTRRRRDQPDQVARRSVAAPSRGTPAARVSSLTLRTEPAR